MPIRRCGVHIEDRRVGWHPTNDKRLITDGLNGWPWHQLTTTYGHCGTANLGRQPRRVFPIDEIEAKDNWPLDVAFNIAPLWKITFFPMFHTSSR